MSSLAAGGSSVSVLSSKVTTELGIPAPSLEGKQDSNLERKETEQGRCVPGWICETAVATVSAARGGDKTDTLQEQMGKTSILPCLDTLLLTFLCV